jgi:hypothetical protein
MRHQARYAMLQISTHFASFRVVVVLLLQHAPVGIRKS